MSTVLDEVTGVDVTIDADFIQRRVDDWQKRVNDLFARIVAWLPPEYEAKQGVPRVMDETMMREFDVGARQLPVMDVFKDGRNVGRLEPRGLWIIGANGRVDLTIGSRYYVIVDEAESFETPRWNIAPLTDRRDRKPLNKSSLIGAIGS